MGGSDFILRVRYGLAIAVGFASGTQGLVVPFVLLAATPWRSWHGIMIGVCAANRCRGCADSEVLR